MKAIIWALLFLSATLLDSATWAIAASSEKNFLQCLEKQAQPSKPISHAIYTPNNSSFLPVLRSYARNLRCMTPTTPKPLAIVAAEHETHVQATVICSKSVGLEMRIRSGGHDYDGLSYVSNSPFIILDMFNLRSIDINMTDKTAWVQAGATVGEVYYRIAEKSSVYGFPAGVCPSLGTGGHFSGGGYGNMMRKYGLSVDNIVDALVVDVKGHILDRKAMGEDLFWAIRGGGAASFCVVLSWKIKLVPVPEKVTVFKVEKTLEQGAGDIVVKWQEVADKLDEDLFIRLMLSPANGSREGEKTVKASFVGMFLGQPDRLLQLMNLNLSALGLEPKDCIEMKWIESVLFWFDYPKGTPTDALLNRIPGSQIFLKRKSDYVQEPIPRAGLEAIYKAMIESENVAMLWNPYGGKMSKISETETPFPHRAGNLFKIQYSVNWQEEGNEITNKYLKLTQKLYDSMTPYVSKNPREAFLNYRDIDIGISSNGAYKEAEVYGIKYFKNNFDRLVKVKTKVDPENFFRYEQSIPTAPS